MQAIANLEGSSDELHFSYVDTVAEETVSIVLAIEDECEATKPPLSTSAIMVKGIYP